MKRFLFALTITFFLAGGYVYATYKPPVRSFHSEKANFKLVTVAGGLQHPWGLAFLPGAQGYLVTERGGKLWHISKDGERTEIKNAPAVYAEGQGGLLDVLVPPDFAEGGWIYLTYAGPDKENPDLAGTEAARAKLYLTQHRLDDVEVIFRQNPKVESDVHFGSRMVLAPNGTLYITAGERGDMTQAQNPKRHQGKVVRINTDGSLPADNPFASSKEVLPEIYSTGHRNPQGLTLNPVTGEVWEIEHGPQGGDEINILKAGANYGWPEVTFGRNYVIGTKISEYTHIDGMQDPIWQWTPSIAPSGAAFYTGDVFPAWKGNLFVGALAFRQLDRMEIENNTVVSREVLIKDFKQRVRDVRNGPDGYLYLLTDEENGEILRLEPL